MHCFSYKIEHDYGLAPNPFHGYCTLAVCKSTIRKNRDLVLGDWVVGTGSKGLGNLHHLIYAMCIEEKIEMDAYWHDSRFQCKKPVLNGTLVKMYGDNFYHKDSSTNEWIQDDSAHALGDGTVNRGHLERDTGGKYVLISQNFFYFGQNAPRIPKEYLDVCCEGRDIKWRAISEDVALGFVDWLQNNYSVGIHGDPISWSIHNGE